MYDPAVAVNKATTALLAMTALDTTNLRITFTVPDSGTVRVRLAGTIHGATTVPQIVLGVLEGATVRGRQRPMLGGGNVAATTGLMAEATFLVTGLTPSANLTWDAAYGVETVVAATGLKYGGPNNTTANDAFGGFAFEIWDVTTQGAGGGGATAQQIWEYAARTLTAGTNIVLAKGTGVTGFNDLSAAQVNAECDTALSDAGVTTVVTGRIDAAVSTRSTYAGSDTAGTTTLLDRVTAIRAGLIDNLDATVGSRMAAVSYTPPDNAGITTAAAAAVAASADTTAIKAKTDLMEFNNWNCLKSDSHCINGLHLAGSGTTSDPWRPA